MNNFQFTLLCTSICTVILVSLFIILKWMNDDLNKIEIEITRTGIGFELYSTVPNGMKIGMKINNVEYECISSRMNTLVCHSL